MIVIIKQLFNNWSRRKYWDRNYNQLLNIKFKKLILIDNSEYNLYKLSNILDISKHHKKFILNLLDFMIKLKFLNYQSIK